MINLLKKTKIIFFLYVKKWTKIQIKCKTFYVNLLNWSLARVLYTLRIARAALIYWDHFPKLYLFYNVSRNLSRIRKLALSLLCRAWIKMRHQVTKPVIIPRNRSQCLQECGDNRWSNQITKLCAQRWRIPRRR